MAKIELANGKGVAVINDEDLDLVSGYKWFSKDGYAMTHVYINGKRTSAYMHRLIINAPPDMQVDHIDGEPSNNLRSNLRVCTTAENQHNQHTRRSASGYKGVFRGGKRWRAMIRFGGKQHYIGTFDKPEEAAMAYDRVAVINHGAFANLNF
jgi:hypothetical protein